MACRATWSPAASAERTAANRAADSYIARPLEFGLSSYGSKSHADCAPSDPSAKSFTPPRRSIESPNVPCRPRPARWSWRSGLTRAYTRVLSSPARRRVCQARSSLAEQAIVWTLVTPTEAAWAVAARAACRFCDGVRGGMTRWTIVTAASTRMPVGRCVRGSRSICPPGGSGVWAVTPAASSAAELARATCPSSRGMSTGFRGVTGSMSCRLGRRRLGQASWSQRQPVIHSPGGRPSAYRRMASTNSRSSRLRRRSRPSWPNPPCRKCTCTSLKPGTTRRPEASMTRVPRPTSGRMSASAPTATIRSPITAIARAAGWRGSPVQMLALTMARSIMRGSWCDVSGILR